MIGRYAVLSSRIRQDVADLERVVVRVERAIRARHQLPQDADLFIDSVALNLHDFYTGLERLFEQIATGVDQSVPSGPDWHRDLLRQMTLPIPGLRPWVIDDQTAVDVDEYLRFRHVVRHRYAFELDPERVEYLAGLLRPTYQNVSATLIALAVFLEGLAHNT
jgi:hypothetical protein